MIVDALVKANDYLEISSHIHDPSQYWKVLNTIYQSSHAHVILFLYSLFTVFLLSFKMQLDDSVVKTIETASDQELKESRDLILRIRRRNLYQVLTFFLHYSFCTSMLHKGKAP